MYDKNLMHALRKEKKISMKDLSQLIGVNISTLGKWERGLSGPSEKMLPKLVEALGVDLETIESIWPRCIVEGCYHIRNNHGDLCAFHSSKRETFPKSIMSRELKNSTTLGQRLRTLRHEKAIPPHIIAKTFGVTLDTVEAWEDDKIKPTLMTTIDFAQYHKVTVRFLEKGNWEETLEEDENVS